MCIFIITLTIYTTVLPLTLLVKAIVCKTKCSQIVLCEINVEIPTFEGHY
jgi:hypothetical protein